MQHPSQIKIHSGLPVDKCSTHQTGHLTLNLAVTSAGPYANLHITATYNRASIPPLRFYRLDILPATQPTTSKH